MLPCGATTFHTVETGRRRQSELLVEAERERASSVARAGATDSGRVAERARGLTRRAGGLGPGLAAVLRRRPAPQPGPGA